MKRKGSAGQSGGKVKGGVEWFRLDDKQVVGENKSRSVVLKSKQKKKQRMKMPETLETH